ncbi:Malignant T-cell-amplified sequence 1 -like protein [Babesia sp. Xinjiang]|uniref:Malignant T-cell-amplified sequence 1 -like protein n=1 Tax=Babesia sp. Xinjiang TaxID=462227 RepID=UPI000A2268E1|nr:Malignant T-cell-amplified sequence 1 -like protein [Babesia sp. Xinjiang]ORM40518.1 Malignant T-cell-amplified sequence 1 -like protein [Babesia sp. Xinjiang]
MYFGWKARFTLGSYAPSFLLILLPLQTISGLWVGKSISDFPLNWNSKVIHKPRAHQYFGSLDDVLVFVVESQYSSPVTLTIGKECIITAFIDSKDATDFLAEIAQTEPPDGIRDLEFVHDKEILEKYGIPVPPPVLRIAASNNRMGIYNLVKHVLVRYEETLLEEVTSVTNEKFDKRKTMFVKLIAAITIRWYTMYRWKTLDRLLLKPLNNEGRGKTKTNHEKVRNCDFIIENTHLLCYSRQNCHTSSGTRESPCVPSIVAGTLLYHEKVGICDRSHVTNRLLEDWNETRNIFERYKLQDSIKVDCEMTDVMDRLNELMYEVIEVHEGKNDFAKQKLEILLNDTQGDVRNAAEADTVSVEVLRKQKINEFQTTINVGINDFEDLLVSLSVQFNNLSQFSRLLSQKLFVKKDSVEYINILKTISHCKMARKFSTEDIVSQNLIKSSIQRGIKLAIASQFPGFRGTIDAVMPKKGNIILAKCQDHLTLLLVGGEIAFFQKRDGPWVPSLRLVHKYPHMMPKMQIDKGALKFILRGSNVMCPGLTSEGGYMDDVDRGEVVQIVVDGREHACAVGVTTMSTAEIREKNKDMCIENLHYLNDGIWKFGIPCTST